MKPRQKLFLDRRLFGVFGLILVLVAIIPYWWVHNTDNIRDVAIMLSEAESNLRFSERTVHQNPVQVGETSHGSVSVENIGNKVIEEMAVMSSCSCSEIYLPKTTLNPGESIQINFSIDTKGRGGDVVNTFVVRYSEDGHNRFDVFYVTVPVVLPNVENGK